LSIRLLCSFVVNLRFFLLRESLTILHLLLLVKSFMILYLILYLGLNIAVSLLRSNALRIVPNHWLIVGNIIVSLRCCLCLLQILLCLRFCFRSCCDWSSSSIFRRTVTQDNATTASSGHSSASFIVLGSILLLSISLETTVIHIVMMISASVPVHLCMGRRSSITHGNVVSARYWLSNGTILGSIFVAGVCVRW
jgi:hypothetical protein